MPKCKKRDRIGKAVDSSSIASARASSMQCSEKQHRVRDVRTLLSGDWSATDEHGALKPKNNPEARSPVLLGASAIGFAHHASV